MKAPRDQGALDAPILSQGRNQARRGQRRGGPSCPIRPSRTLRSKLELEAKGTKFYGGTAPLIATKEPPSSTNQPGHRALPRVDK